MSRFDYCLKSGMIRKDSKATERVSESIETSKRFLISSEKTYDIKEYEMSVLASYNSMFHSCRVLLFSKGYIEKSHACLLEAIKELFSEGKISSLVNMLNKIKKSRHEIQYRGFQSDLEEAEFAIDLARDFINEVGRILGQ
jgi:uncharacterized protein (UPF0332 family)